MIYNDVIEFEALYKSQAKCRRNVMWKDSVVGYTLNALESTEKLSNDLKFGTYKSRKPYSFTITSPKKRDIVSTSFRDRVYQRSINDNILYPAMTKSFIKQNCACQHGLGTDFARSTLKRYLTDFYNKNQNNDGYVLQIDIRGYYPNMRHRYIENLFASRVDAESSEKINDILHSQYSGDIGYNPGSQLIQIAGISALDYLDHKIKERMRIKYYVRYMDDCILIHKDKAHLEVCRRLIDENLNAVGFSLNPDKTKIYKISDGVPFLGFRFVLKPTGKVLLLPKPDKVKSIRRRFKNMVKRAKQGHMTKHDCDVAWQCTMAHLSKGNTYYLRRRLTEYYDSLWR